MAITTTLDSIRKAADKKYGAYGIDFGDNKHVELVNALRLSKAQRTKLKETQARAKAEGEEGKEADPSEWMTEMFRIVGRGHVKELLEEIGDDLGILVSLMEAYTDQTELGEASASQS